MSGWSYAPTNRAGCKGQCKQKIEKGAVRFGTEVDIGGHTNISYRNLKCVTAKQFANMNEKFGDLKSVPGFADLKEEDQKRVLEQASVASKAEEDAEAARQAEKDAKQAEKDAKVEAKARAKAEKAEAKAKAAAEKAKAKEEKAKAKAAADGPATKRAKTA
eukprot:TRINITY_DN65432_c0_g1_i1.p2 TRINITY_DN65432_c0_g1~~TRINITY_DN65432_c0_g1_i1.p2  ORF type:complete len:161 (+),score=53.67 TRINITY_DN65432_c0_g1_i1:52-534(+)